MPRHASDPRVVLGQRLADYRMARKLTRKGLAEAAQIDVSNLRGIEAGEGNPRLLTVLKIAGLLEIELSELFRGIDPLALPPHERPTPASEFPETYWRHGDRIA